MNFSTIKQCMNKPIFTIKFKIIENKAYLGEKGETADLLKFLSSAPRVNPEMRSHSLLPPPPRGVPWRCWWTLAPPSGVFWRWWTKNSWLSVLPWSPDQTSRGECWILLLPFLPILAFVSEAFTNPVNFVNRPDHNEVVQIIYTWKITFTFKTMKRDGFLFQFFKRIA